MCGRKIKLNRFSGNAARNAGLIDVGEKFEEENIGIGTLF